MYSGLLQWYFSLKWAILGNYKPNDTLGTDPVSVPHYVLFDYQERNPLNYEAKVQVIGNPIL